MAKADLLDILYTKEKSPLEFNFDSLWMPALANFISPQDEQRLYTIASSIRYSGNIELKYKMIDDVMVPRGFKKFHCGTNRIVYKYLENTSFVVKIALDKVGLGDNIAEFKNMFLLRPFVAKTFEVSPSGVIATAERVEPILSREEFMAVGEEVFDLLANCIVGKYVLEDVGSKYFMNYGLRKGFGPVLLDYTYVYELDGAKLSCNLVDKVTGYRCDGVIDYDTGFNNLVCNKCGKRYLARKLEKDIKEKILIVKKGKIDMKAELFEGDQLIAKLGERQESPIIKKNNDKPIVNGMIGVTFVDDDDNEIDMQPVNNIADSMLFSKEKAEKITEDAANIMRETIQSHVEDFDIKSTFIPDVTQEEKDELSGNDEKTISLDTNVFGLTDKDFEEPTYDEQKEEEEYKDEIIEKYSEYASDDEPFEKFNKKKRVHDEY